MKVLINNNRENFRTVACPHCQSSLEIESKDIIYNEIAHRCSTFEVACGACGKNFGVNENQVPKTWLSNAIEE